MAQAIMQAWIDAKQSVATIEYGLRSLRTCGSWCYCTGPHAAQLSRARFEAGRVLGREGAVQLDNGCEFLLRRALGIAKERLAEAAAAKKAIGGLRQLRLALAA